MAQFDPHVLDLVVEFVWGYSRVAPLELVNLVTFDSFFFSFSWFSFSGFILSSAAPSALRGVDVDSQTLFLRGSHELTTAD